MKKTILALALAAGLTSFAGSAKAGISFTSVQNNFDPYYTGYDNTIYYGALSAGTILDMYSSDTFHFYGPYATRDNWKIKGGGNGAYATATLANNTLGGSFYVATLTQITGVEIGATQSPAAVPEPSQVAASLLLAAGIAGFVIVRRRQNTSLALAA